MHAECNVLNAFHGKLTVRAKGRVISASFCPTKGGN
jgi:hypothetical protein